MECSQTRHQNPMTAQLKAVSPIEKIHLKFHLRPKHFVRFRPMNVWEFNFPEKQRHIPLSSHNHYTERMDHESSDNTVDFTNGPLKISTLEQKLEDSRTNLVSCQLAFQCSMKYLHKLLSHPKLTCMHVKYRFTSGDP